MEKEKKKNTMLLAIIAIAVLLVAIGGAAFAYFQAQVGSGTNVSVTATTQSTDQLTFTAAAIVVGPANQTNFYQGAGNQSDTESATVVLKANPNSPATYCYTAGLSVTSNTFEYTTEGQNPPAELTVTAVKNSATVLNAYDITETATGTVSFPTALNGNTNTHTITATAGNTTTDTWSITVTFVNLSTDQSLQGQGQTNNLNKSFSGNVVFTRVSCS